MDDCSITAKEMILVTAFFDIGRVSFDIWARSNEEYFSYFDMWARIQNRLIVYCAPENVQTVLEIRKKYQREQDTVIIPIEDIFQIEPEIYQKMKIVEGSEKFKRFRYYYHAMSNKADYDYLMLMKYWFLWDASVQYAGPDEKTVWLDFGYNHGGAYYIDPQDFDFKWEYSFDDHINMFCLSDPEDMPAIDSLQFQKDCFIGHTVVCPGRMTSKLWTYMKEAMYSLLSLDCIDDDQQLLLMMYKLHKDECTIRVCDWFHDLELCSNQKFSVKASAQTPAGQYSRKNDKFVERCVERVQCYYDS